MDWFFGRNCGKSASANSTVKPHVDPRWSPPRHAVQLRQAHKSWASGCSAAAGGALPHTNLKLLAHRDTGPAFRELAAGPARQLARAFRVSGKSHRILGDGRFARRSRG